MENYYYYVFGLVIYVFFVFIVYHIKKMKRFKKKLKDADYSIEFL